MMTRRYLLVGPLTPPVHGQSLAFTRVCEHLGETHVVINTNTEQCPLWKKVPLVGMTLAETVFKTLLYRVDAVYFTCSRSFLGSIRDVLLINVAAWKKIPLINHLHGSDFYEFLHGVPGWYKKILLKSYAKVGTSIVLLDAMKQQFRDFPRMHVETVPNFYDEALEIEVLPKSTDGVRLLYLSNIIASKGIFELIEAFKRLCVADPTLRLHIAGGFIGDEYLGKEAVETRFYDAIDGHDGIVYHGVVSGTEKTDLLAKSDIFALPSYFRSEAFPISIIEAMRCANAIVTTNYKYLPEVVGEENGAVVPIKSVDALTEALEGLVCDKERLRSVQHLNCERAKKDYTIKAYLSHITRLLEANHE